MKRFTYRLRLCKDAELGTGLGGATVNEFVPRDIDGNPIIPASHIKGLMRAALREIAEYRYADWAKAFEADPQDWPDCFLDRVFGRHDQQNHDGRGILRVDDASVSFDESEIFGWDSENCEEFAIAPTRFVSRTALEPLGIAKETSLRTTEAIPRGIVFDGHVFTDAADDSVEGVAWRLALLGISAIGGSRSRGGQCTVTLMNEDGSECASAPGSLLRQLHTAIVERRITSSAAPANDALTGLDSNHTSGELEVVELLFVASSPVCCPERADKSNVIEGGFSIPASAVQGIVLNHVNARNHELANKLFANCCFRCWPLNPCVHPSDAKFEGALRGFPDFDGLPNSIRVSLSHRAAKFSLSEEYTPEHFFDMAFGSRIEAYNWPEVPDGASLKHADGVLLFGPSVDAGSQLWKATEMPRQVTTHGVLDGVANPDEPGNRRNLFSVDAMAPLVWRGWVTVPIDTADALVTSLNDNPEISIGKGKSVRGSGRLFAQRARDFAAFSGSRDAEQSVLVLQSQALIPKGHFSGLSARETLQRMASRWLKRHALPELAGQPDCWANLGIRFGWSRHGGNGHGHGTNFQEAVRVLLPGSTFTIAGQADTHALRRATLSGFHAFDTDEQDIGRQRGFGAICVHPGKANGLYRGQRSIRKAKQSGFAAALRIVLSLEHQSIPDASQIRAVQRHIRLNEADDDLASLAAAKQYLLDQCTRKIDVWFAWQDAVDAVDKLLKDFRPSIAYDALSVLANIAIRKRMED